MVGNGGPKESSPPPKQVLLWEPGAESNTKLSEQSFIVSIFTDKRQYVAGLLFLPLLIVIAILSGIEAEEGGGMKCESPGWRSQDTLEIEGREYSLYTFEKDDFEMISASYIPPGTDLTCDVFTDWDLQNADRFNIQVHVDKFGEMHENCYGGIDRCDVAVQQDGDEWIEVNPRDSNQVGAYFAYNDRGFFENGQITVAVDSENTFKGIEVTVHKDTNPLFIFSFILVPVGGTVGFFLAKKTGYDDFARGMVFSMKSLLGIGLAGLIVLISLTIWLFMTW